MSKDDHNDLVSTAYTHPNSTRVIHKISIPGHTFTPSVVEPGEKAAISQDHASSFLEEAVDTMRARAQLRDAQGSGERSMEKTVAIFNAWTGNNLSVQDGWRFMVALKQAREIQGFYNKDDYVDLAAYAGLLGEEESGNPDRRKPSNG